MTGITSIGGLAGLTSALTRMRNDGAGATDFVRLQNAVKATQPAASGQSMGGDIAANTAFAAQSMGQESPEDRFLAFQEMSPQEKYFHLFLQQMGLTEEELEQMPAAEREKVLETIRQKVQEKINEDLREKSPL